MEVSGVVFRRIPCFSGIGAGIDTHSVGFRDKGHLQCCYGGPRCGGKKEKEKVTMKKKLKLLKGLSKDLSVFSDLGFGDALIGQVQGQMVSEAAETLLKQLQQVKAEEKELKKKRKQDKAKLKATRMKTMLHCESSESESSDSECGDVIDITRLRNEATAQPILSKLQPVTLEATTPTLPILMTQEVNASKENDFEDHSVQSIEQQCCTGPSTSCSSVGSISRDDASSSSVTKRIEVCMGKKCKKSGGAALLEEFERVLGVEGGVVGCKCMGKCRDGPNVRVLNSVDGIQSEVLDDSVRTPGNPLCIGVGLEDVGVIVANLFGDDSKDLGFTPAS